ncbi:MAG TPA: class I SAM-dependent methyltransferase [Ramlibacter sp.]|nr:class I SAM-dependent methyltransferase [Ramlibacter sp.]
MAPSLSDPWLERWLPQLRAATGELPLLELGCDTGGDTAWLVERGFRVVATDVSTRALEACARNAPAAQRVHHDLRETFPFEGAHFGVVIASLCLHYFDWATTVAAVQEIRRCLAPGGLFLCRVNSERDVLHGAGQGEEIEPGFYRQHAHYADCKRFFGSGDLDRLFPPAHWRETSRREVTIHRYARPKVAWELALAPVQTP